MVSPELLEYIQQITNASVAGTVTWARPNPTTFSWQPSQEVLITIQKVDRAQSTRNQAGGRVIVKVTNYVFQVADRNGRSGLSVSSSDNPELKLPLEQLYVAADNNAMKNAVQFLKSLLPPNA